MGFDQGQRIRLPGETAFVVVDGAIPSSDGSWRLYLSDGAAVRPVTLSADEVDHVELLAEDGKANSTVVLAGLYLWAEWMRRAAVSSKATALASSTLNPYPHQNRAVYGTMLPQPLLRFILADEPGAGKTIMGGLWLRAAQRLGFVKRALIACPAHLVSKWQADFERFLGGDLPRIEGETTARTHSPLRMICGWCHSSPTRSFPRPAWMWWSDRPGPSPSRTPSPSPTAPSRQSSSAASTPPAPTAPPRARSGQMSWTHRDIAS